MLPIVSDPPRGLSVLAEQEPEEDTAHDGEVHCHNSFSLSLSLSLSNRSSSSSNSFIIISTIVVDVTSRGPYHYYRKGLVLA